MTEAPHPILFDRKAAIEAMAARYKPQIDLLEEMANYGSNLLHRSLTGRSASLTDLVVLGTLLKHFTSMIDAAEVLLRAGCVLPAQLPIRTAFEASLFIDFILIRTDKIDEKALYYVVSQFRDERIWAERVIEGTEEFKKYDTSMGDIGKEVFSRQPNLPAEGAKRLELINKILASDQFRKADENFTERKAKDSRHREPSWYSFFDAYSVRHLASLSLRLPEYEIIYALASEVTHGDVFNEHVRLNSDTASLGSIRFTQDAGRVLQAAHSLCMYTYGRVLHYYRADEIPSFYKRTYLEDWRERFLALGT